jgi:SulP family sulfate permease
MLLASLFFIYRMQDLTNVEHQEVTHPRLGVHLYAMQGSLFFGAVGKLDNQLDPARMGDLEVLVLNMHDVINIDTTGIDWLQGLHKTLTKQGAELVLCELRTQPASILQRSGLIGLLGVHNVCADQAVALLRARDIQGERE